MNRSTSPEAVRGTALLTKALDILEFVGEGDRRIKFKDIAEYTGHTRSTLYRILAALTSRGMLDLDKRDQSYILGPRFTAMSGSISQNSELIARASGPLRDLAEMYGENINLAVLNGTAPVTVARWQGSAAQPFSVPLGEKKPLHATSLGKAILAFADEATAADLLCRIDYTRYTARTLVTSEALQADLSICRARGYAMDDNEILDGVVCVAAPIYGPDGRVAGSASFNVPAHRMDPARRGELASLLIGVTRQISEDMALHGAMQRDHALSPQLRVMDVKAFQARNLLWSDAERALYWIDRAGGTVNRQVAGQREVIAAFPGAVEAISVSDGGLVHAVHDGRLWRIDDRQRCELLAHPVLAGVTRMHQVNAGFLLTSPQGLHLLTLDGEARIILRGDGRFHSSGVTGDGQIAAASEDGSEVEILRISDDGRVDPVRRVTLERPAPRLVALHLGNDGTISLSQRDGWAIWRYDGAGAVLGSFALPVPSLVSMAGGEEPSIVYAGSDRLSLSSNQLRLAPLSGGIFRIDGAA
ncbi:IclR family transcriptional regulator domain-containing protein [Falsirhodobacter xinxiangensis]|uniref:IclR family transcriptional regulator domain-containing protein n=1 Tax=Falsirhodobacter xinxiangensis TaxID=2530049 RepID=UPI0010AA8175|nr:IclR family transcriptional regulator C-terminal domain-containing protein [Rhodobacter xinxiangensis]